MARDAAVQDAPPRANAAPASLREELGKRGDFESSEQEAYLNLMRTASQLAVGFERLFEGFGLSESLYNTLRIVAGHGRKGVRSQTIAQHLVSRGPDVTRLVDRLVKRGLVERRPCERDRRVVHVRLTRAGRALLAKMNPAVSDLHRRQLSHLDDEQLHALNLLLFAARHAD